MSPFTNRMFCQPQTKSSMKTKHLKSIVPLFFCLIVFNLNAQYAYDTIDPNAPKVGQTIVVPIFNQCEGPFYRDFKSEGSFWICNKLSNIKGATYQLEVHTDCRGDSIQNMVKTQMMADTFSAIFHRVCKSSIMTKTIGMGESQPAIDCECFTVRKDVKIRDGADTFNVGILKYGRTTQDSSIMSRHKETILIERSIKCAESDMQKNRRIVIKIIALRDEN